MHGRNTSGEALRFRAQLSPVPVITPAIRMVDMSLLSQPSHYVLDSPIDPFLHIENEDTPSTLSSLSISTSALMNNAPSSAAKSDGSWVCTYYSTKSLNLGSPYAIPPQVLRSQICYGISLRGVADGEQASLSFSRKPIATAQETPSVKHISTSDAIMSSTGFSEENNLFRLGFSRHAAKAAARWSNILEERISDDNVPVIYVTCRRPHTKVVVATDLEDMEPHPEFVDAVTKAVALPTQEEQALALKRVLKRWGALVTTRVEIGCASVSTHTFVNPSVSMRHCQALVQVT
jgi:hypothetical protein